MLVAIGFNVFTLVDFFEHQTSTHFVSVISWTVYLTIIGMFENLLTMSKRRCTLLDGKCADGEVDMAFTIQMGCLFWCLLAPVEIGCLLKALFEKCEN